MHNLETVIKIRLKYLIRNFKDMVLSTKTYLIKNLFT